LTWKATHLQLSTFCRKFMFTFFYQRWSCTLPAECPPSHRFEYASSTGETVHKPLGTDHTHVIPVKAPLPLWWQPSYHHKMPQSPVCLKNSTKLSACWLKKGFVCL
jgi:hypothetical protein